MVRVVLKKTACKLKNKKTRHTKPYQGPETILGPNLSLLCVLVVVVDAFGRVEVVVVVF
jgi:hypothetical protein